MRLLFSPETVHEKGENAVTGFVSNEFAPRKDVRPAVGRGRLFIFQGPSYPSVPWVNLGVFECQRFISVTSLFQSSSPQRSHWTTQKNTTHFRYGHKLRRSKGVDQSSLVRFFWADPMTSTWKRCNMYQNQTSTVEAEGQMPPFSQLYNHHCPLMRPYLWGGKSGIRGGQPWINPWIEWVTLW